MIIGIDLGTTNSLAAVWKDAQAQIVPNALGHRLTPSAVGIDDNGELLVGMSARERLISHPQQTAALFKRYMGSKRLIRLGEREFLPEELSSFVLRSLKADAESFLGEPVHEAVITVPAYFSDAQRKATKAAGQLAGLKVERLLNEPTAAALAYGLHQRDWQSKFLVFDLGGGTFDVSILELFEGVMEVRASAGDNFLGGEDFVACLVERFLQAAIIDKSLSVDCGDPALRAAARDQAEKAKRCLDKADAATLEVLWRGQPLAWTVTADEFVQLTESLLQRMRQPLERALRDARIRAAELDDVVLAGGATKQPGIRRMTAKMFGRLPASHINPEEVVALGAAVQAGLKMRDKALEEIVMTDVCPYTLGIEVAETLSNKHLLTGFFSPIIERNTVIPVSRSQCFTTVDARQRVIDVRIYQGESRMVKDNIFLGRINVPVTPLPAGEENLEVRFTYDVNGLLEVEATVNSTGQKHQLILEEMPGTWTAEQIQTRLAELAELKIHPRENALNRALLARLERLYEQALGEVRTVLGEYYATFQLVLERQDNKEIEALRENLSELLDRIEADSYL